MSKPYRIPYTSVEIDDTAKPLGNGSFGIVRRGIWCGTPVAVKEVLKKHQTFTEAELNNFRREGRTNHAIPCHTNILAFFGIIDEPGRYALVMELMPGGSLFDLISSGKSLAWDRRRKMGPPRSLISDSASLSKDYHQTSGNEFYDLTRNIGCVDGNKFTAFCIVGGTLPWKAPELLTFTPKVTKECDVFSYGITLTELFTMAGPYGINYNELDADTLIALVKSGERRPLPSNIPDDLLKLVQDCWAHDPKQRPPFSLIVARLDISGPAPVYKCPRDELYFTPPPRYSGNNGQNTTPVTAAGSGESAYSTPPPSSPVSQGSARQPIDGASQHSGSAASDVASLTQQLDNLNLPAAVRKQIGRLSPATELTTPTATPPKSPSASMVKPKDLDKLYEVGRALDGAGDHSAALEWYHKAAIAGHPASQAEIGYKFCEGKGVEKDCAKAVEWLLRAADQGDPKGQYYLGHHYRFHCPKSWVQQEMAMHWFEKAAEQGYARAQATVGYTYMEGRFGVARDEKEGAAKQGDDSLRNYYEVSIWELQETGGEWRKKVAELGVPYAQNDLGYDYMNGRGVAKNETKAMEWYKRSAEQGDAVGQFNLGKCYHHGTGVAKNETRAVEWYMKAAAQGNTDAIPALAKLGVRL
ncbi:hypothetical protein HK104_009873 [Borealophlyctis nickersoniae]|nr:hypothetical protein HK104_009873 [Borealophlyctis nickersoniae]